MLKITRFLCKFFTLNFFDKSQVWWCYQKGMTKSVFLELSFQTKLQSYKYILQPTTFVFFPLEVFWYWVLFQLCFFDFQPGIKPRVDGKKGIPASAHRKLGSDLSALKAGLSVRIVNDVSLIFTIDLLEDMTH